jgi:hypothetical protein
MRNGPRNKNGTTWAAAGKPVRIERGSVNVFADLGLPHSDLALAKTEFVQRIRGFIAERRLTPAKAAKLLELDQPVESQACARFREKKRE